LILLGTFRFCSAETCSRPSPVGDFHLLFFASFLAHSETGQTATCPPKWAMSALPPIPEAMATSRMVPPVRTSAFPSACGEISRALLNARPIGAAGVIQRSLGCFCLKLPATLSPPDDRMPGPRLGAHRPAAKAHTRGGQYQFERACPLVLSRRFRRTPSAEFGKR